MALLVFCFPVKLLLNEFLPKRVKEKTDRLDRVLTHSTLQSKTKITGLVLAIILCIILVLIPHQLTINKDGQRIGVDTQYYVNWTSSIAQSGSFQEAVGEAFVVNGGDRPLSLLLLHSLVKIMNTNSAFATIEYIPSNPGSLADSCDIPFDPGAYRRKRLSIYIGCLFDCSIISYFSRAIRRFLCELDSNNFWICIICISFQISQDQ